MPLGNLGGIAAMAQMRGGRHFLAEHPQSSDLWRLPTWRLIASECSIARVLVHQCRAGLKGRRSGIPVMKPTEFWASDPLLVSYLHGLRCDGRQRHASLDCPEGAPGDQARDAARWPPKLWHLIPKVVRTCFAETRNRKNIRRVREIGLLQKW